MFFDIESMIPWDRIRPHAESARETAIRYADGILDRLDSISEAVSTPDTVQTVRSLPFGFQGAGDTATFDVPAGEKWQLIYCIQFSPVANARITMREGGQLRWVGFNSPDVGGSGPTGLELVGPMQLTLTSEWAADNPVELFLQFAVSRPAPKSHTRRNGLWEQLAQNYDAVNGAEDARRHLNIGYVEPEDLNGAAPEQADN